MSLEFLANTLSDYVYFTGSHYADLASTYIFVKRDGIASESHKGLRKLMQEMGEDKALLTHLILGTIGNVFLVGAAYGLDSLLGIQDNALNIHHVQSYGLGTIKYLTAISNIANTYGYSKVADIFSLPARMY